MRFIPQLQCCLAALKPSQRCPIVKLTLQNTVSATMLAMFFYSSANANSDTESVVISASKSQTRLENMPLNTTVITQDDIQKTSARTLDQLLRDVPGFQFTGVPSTQSDPTGQQTKLRGLGNAKVLVLVDGVPVLDPFYLTTQWFKVPLSNIERVEIVRGGSSSLWGNMAVAGVVNIITKKSMDGSGVAMVSAGSRGSNDISISKNFSQSEAFGFNLTADQVSSKGYTLTPTQYAWMYPGRGPVNAKDTNLQFSAYFKPSSDLNGFFKLGYHIQDQDISYQYGQNLQKSPDFSAGLTRKLDASSQVNMVAWGQEVSFQKYNGAVCVIPSGATGASACKDPTTLTQAQVSTGQPVQIYSQYGAQSYHENGASAVYSKQLDGLLHEYQWGLDYRRLSATDHETFYPSSGNGISLATPQIWASSTFGQGTQQFVGAFGQTKLMPRDDLDITFSARLDTYSNTQMDTTRTTVASGTSGGPRNDTHKASFDPSLSAKYFMTDEWALRGAVYKAFRAPGFNNMLRTYGTTPTIANPDLLPETLYGKEIGLDYRSKDLYLSGTYFDYQIKNMIATYTVTSLATAPAIVSDICGGNLSNCGGTPKYYTNDQNGASNGFEWAAKWTLNENFALNGAFTHTHTYLTSHGSIVTDPLNRQLAGVPWNVAIAGLTWTPDAQTRLYVQARNIGSMYIDTTSTGAPYTQTSNTVYDASAAYAWDKQTDIVLSGSNVFNKQYNEGAYTYNKPWTQTVSLPRTYFLSLKTRF